MRFSIHAGRRTGPWSGEAAWLGLSRSSVPNEPHTPGLSLFAAAGVEVIESHDGDSAPPVPIEPHLSSEAAEEIAKNLWAAKSPNTRRTYRAGLRTVVDWIHGHHPEAVRQGCDDPLLAIMPIHSVTLVDLISRLEVSYVDGEGKHRTRLASTSTLATYLAAVRGVHRHRGHPDPTAGPVFEEAWKGVRNRRGTDQQAKTELRWAPLKQLIDAADAAALAGVRPWRNPLIHLRDRAVLLVGFAGAFRRSELVSFREHDVRLPDGPEDSLGLVLQRSKRSSKPVEVEIPRRDDRYCPVSAFLAWRDAASELDLPSQEPPHPRGAPLLLGFRGSRPMPGGLSSGSVARIVKRLAREAGFSSARISETSAHSLRSGAATSAAEIEGVSLLDIKDLGRWRSLDTVDRYVRRRRKGKDHPVARMK